MNITMKVFLFISLLFMSSMAMAHPGGHAHLGHFHLVEVAAILSTIILALTAYCYKK